MVAVFCSSFEFLIPAEGGVTFGGDEASGFDALLFLLLDDAVKFDLPCGEELSEEGVADASGVEGGITVVVLPCFIPCEEEHEFGKFVGGCFA